MHRLYGFCNIPELKTIPTTRSLGGRKICCFSVPREHVSDLCLLHQFGAFIPCLLDQERGWDEERSWCFKYKYTYISQILRFHHGIQLTQSAGHQQVKNVAPWPLSPQLLPLPSGQGPHLSGVVSGAFWEHELWDDLGQTLFLPTVVPHIKLGVLGPQSLKSLSVLKWLICFLLVFSTGSTMFPVAVCVSQFREAGNGDSRVFCAAIIKSLRFSNL